MNIMQNDVNIYRNSANFSSETLIFLHPEQIRTSDTPKKGRSSENARIRMAESIRKYGVLQPFQVKPSQESCGYTCYRLIAEEERFRAACVAGIERIPCILLDVSDKRCEGLSLLADFKAVRHHFLEEAVFFERLTREYGMKQAEIAAKMGISQSTVANKLRLLQLDERARAAIHSAKLGERHARAILRLEGREARLSALETVILRRLSVQETEQYIEQLILGASKSAPAPQEPALDTAAHRQFTPVAPLEEHIKRREEPREAYKEGVFTPFESVLPAEQGIESKTSREPAQEREIGRRIVARIPEPGGIRPHKFILHDLQPLYNSIERTLSIFRKTGMNAECTREERADSVEICIRIPKPSGTTGRFS